MKDHLADKLSDWAGEWARQSFEDDDCLPGGAIKATDSPIEAQLLIATVFYMRLTGNVVNVAKKGSEHNDGWYGVLNHPYATRIIPQFKIRDYRVDFAMFNRAEPSVKIAVECDGHDFHEKTKEQARRDKSRDRLIQSLGFKVLRFTGSEIYRDPVDCASEVHDALLSAVDDIWMARG